MAQVLTGYRSTERAGIKKIPLGNVRMSRMHVRNESICAVKACWSIVALPTPTSKRHGFFHAHRTQHLLPGRWRSWFWAVRGGFWDLGIVHFPKDGGGVKVGSAQLTLSGKMLIIVVKTGNDGRPWTSRCTSVRDALCLEQESPPP